MSTITSSSGESLNSVLQIPHVVFDEINFKRIGFKGNSNDDGNDLEFEFQSNVAKSDDGFYRVTLSSGVKKPEEYEVFVKVTGFCQINENDPNKDILLSENAVSILFPYIRAELSLITAQPGMEPIVLPVLNISAMMKSAKKFRDEKEPHES